MTDTLDDQIRRLMAEVMDAAPQAPIIPVLEWGVDGRRPTPRSEPTRSEGRRRVRALVGASVALTAAVLLLVLLLPTGGRHEPQAAAAELHQIADVAAAQSVPQLANGQWLLTQEQITFVATIDQVGATPTPHAQATVPTTVKVWSNNLGQSCVVATFAPAQFASPVNRAAWLAAGLLVTPSGPSTACTVGAMGRPLTGAGVIDVSGLTTDPVALARELEDGSTGVPAIDEQGAPADAGFNRVAILLFGSTVGATPALHSALYRALALLPGVTSLGNVTTTNGATGVGFAGDPDQQRQTLIIDPRTGALLEAENVQVPSTFAGLGTTFVAPPPAASIETEGGSYGLTILRLEPIGTPTVAPLPAPLTPPAPFGSSGTITATARPGVTYAQVQALAPQLQRGYGKASGSVSTSPITNTPVWTYMFNTGEAAVEGYATILKASGLFSSVVVKPGS